MKSEKVDLRNGDAVLVLVQNGKVLHHSWNMSLPQVEFVRRTVGQLPPVAWIGTVTKLDGKVMAITSKYFYDHQLPAPPEVDAAIKECFG